MNTKNKIEYVAPSIETTNIPVESGFCSSLTGNSTEGFGQKDFSNGKWGKGNN